MSWFQLIFADSVAMKKPEKAKKKHKQKPADKTDKGQAAQHILLNTHKSILQQ